jgi:RNA polymerase sigma factor (sigma-70 family)
MDDIAEEFIPTRKSLLGRLKNWADNDSWRDFFNTYWKLIYSVALKAGLSHSEAEDVVQDTVVAVAKNIGKFHYDPTACAFKTWLMQVTRSKIANQYSKRQKFERHVGLGTDDTSETATLERVPDPGGMALDAIWDDEWQKNLMAAAIAKVKRQVSIEQFQMFDLYVLKNWPVRKIASTLGVSVAHIYVAKHRVARLIKKEVQLLENQAP